MLLNTKARHGTATVCVLVPSRCPLEPQGDGYCTQCEGKTNFPDGTGLPSGQVDKHKKQPSSTHRRETVVGWEAEAVRMAVVTVKPRRQVDRMHED